MENDEFGTDAQKGVYSYYDKWCSPYADGGSGACDYGFPTEIGNTTTDAGDNVVTRATTLADNYTYHVTIYYLKYVPANNSKETINNIQDLILAVPGTQKQAKTKTKEIFIRKEWKKDTYDSNVRDVEVKLINKSTNEVVDRKILTKEEYYGKKEVDAYNDDTTCYWEYEFKVKDLDASYRIEEEIEERISATYSVWGRNKG